MWREPAVARARQMLDEDGRVDPDRLLRIIRKRWPAVEMFAARKVAGEKQRPGLFEVLTEADLLEPLQRWLLLERRRAIRDGFSHA